MNRKLPLLSRVSSIKFAFNPTQPDHVSCRLFLNIIDTQKLRALFPTAKILPTINETITEPNIEVDFVNGGTMKMSTKNLTMNEIGERIQRCIRKVMNSEV
jgi:hypothetical protein